VNAAKRPRFLLDLAEELIWLKDDLPVTVMKSLGDCGKDEYWLQDKIYEDPSVLGLGDLERVSNEKIQLSGGRLDLLLKNPEDDSMFEVEVMLGETDASHIIRTRPDPGCRNLSRWPLKRCFGVRIPLSPPVLKLLRLA